MSHINLEPQLVELSVPPGECLCEGVRKGGINSLSYSSMSVDSHGVVTGSVGESDGTVPMVGVHLNWRVNCVVLRTDFHAQLPVA